MVVFVCNGCQESMNRGKVQAHLQRCRNSHSLSCVDCGAIFDAKTYEKHNSCFSESEKYTGKRDKKQDDWADTVRAALGQISNPTARNAFESVIAKIGEATVPRKKAKFINMCKSSHGYVKADTIDEIWAAIESIMKQKAQERDEQKLKDLEAKRLLKEKAEEEQAKATIEPQELVQSTEQDVEIRRKKLKRALKKAEGNVLSLKSLKEEFGRKRAVKSLVEQFPDVFVLDKDESGDRVVKLVRLSKET